MLKFHYALPFLVLVRNNCGATQRNINDFQVWSSREERERHKSQPPLPARAQKELLYCWADLNRKKNVHWFSNKVLSSAHKAEPMSGLKMQLKTKNQMESTMLTMIYTNRP